MIKTRCALLSFALSLAAASQSGCVSDYFTCTADSQCTNLVDGRCEETGFCSSRDATCTTGHRYARYAVARLAGQCVTLTTAANDAGQDGGIDISRAGGDMCVGSLFDPQNCGSCGVVCAPGLYCENGSCSCPAQIPQACIVNGNTTCTNSNIDIANCGACGHACIAGQRCQAGNCVETCAVGYETCGNYCADTNNDPANCGGCGSSCSTTNIAAACTAGVCAGACNPGFADCDHDQVSNGCEAALNSDVNNCGACNQLCGLGSVCQNGACACTSPAAPNECGATSSASFAGPVGIVADNAGTIFVVDGNAVREIVLATREVATLAGNVGIYGSTDGTGRAAAFSVPIGVAADASGNLYIADKNNSLIRKMVIATNVVTTLAPTTGTGQAATFGGPYGVAVDQSGNLYIADTSHNTIRTLVLASGMVTTLAGLQSTAGTSDGTGTAARFTFPANLIADGAGNLYVADDDAIRRVVTSTGVVTTIAGAVTQNGSADGTGTAARFFNAAGLALDQSGNLFVADEGNHTIRQVTLANSVVSTIAGAAALAGSTNGVGTLARFNNPYGLALDRSGDLFVTDVSTYTVRQIALPSAVVSTIAGTSGVSGAIDWAGPFCVDLQTDNANCGSCYNACLTNRGELCTNGTCACSNSALTTCGAYGCVDLLNDTSHCGTCGHGCNGSAGQYCSNGTCACGAPDIVCGSQCVNPSTDPLNCGGCNNVCPVSAPLCNGSCYCSGTVCGGYCTDLMSDAYNCGSCGNGCNTDIGEFCFSGNCTGGAGCSGCRDEACQDLGFDGCFPQDRQCCSYLCSDSSQCTMLGGYDMTYCDVASGWCNGQNF